MKWIVYISFFFFIGCEEVVDVDLPQPQNLIVIEGWVSDSLSNHPIRITRSNAFSSNDRVSPITDAQVIVQARNGATFNYAYSDDGYYSAINNYRGMSGISYRVLVIIDSKELRSEWDLMPDNVSIGDVFIESFEENDPNNPNQQVTVYYPKVNTIDPKGQRNFYRWIFYKNGAVFNDPEPLTLQDDRLFDGNLIPNNFQSFGYQSGDEIEIQLLSISSMTHSYLSLLKSQITTLGTSGGTIPAIVPGNLAFIDGDQPMILGYFGAVSVSSQKVRVP